MTSASSPPETPPVTPLRRAPAQLLRVTTTPGMLRLLIIGIAGVDQSTYHFGYLNPLNGQIEGFDIDAVHAVAAAIFGNPDKVQFKAITDAQRIMDIQSGAVDMVAHTMTIDCSRLKLVEFSTVYFDAGQRVLVEKGSPGCGIGDDSILAGLAAQDPYTTMVGWVGAPVPAPPLASYRG